MEEIRIGIIGTGTQATYYMKKIFGAGKIEHAHVAAVCDIDEAALSTFRAATGYDGPAFSSYKALIDSGLVDMVMVETPHYLHPEISEYGLTHGVHVLCEKPAGVYTRQVKEMNAVADRSDRLFGLMFNQRTDPVYRKMREMIAAGEIGEVRRINWIITNWFRPQAYYDSSSWRATWKGEGGGVLLNQCPHQLDLISWVTGMMPERVSSYCAFGRDHKIEVEDDVTSVLFYKNGATGVFITKTGEAGGTNRFEVVGNNGKLIAEGGKLHFTRLSMGAREFSETAKEKFCEPKREEILVETEGENLQHTGIIRNFVNAALGIEPLYVKGQDGLAGVELMDAMLLSAFLGKEVPVPVDDDLYFEELQKRIAESEQKA